MSVKNPNDSSFASWKSDDPECWGIVALELDAA
jgi:hypothetical protein